MISRDKSPVVADGWSLIPCLWEEDLVSLGCRILHFAQNDLVKTIIELAGEYKDDRLLLSLNTAMTLQ